MPYLMTFKPLKSGTPKRRRWIRSLVIALGCWCVLAWGAAQALITRAGLAHADAIVVLSGGADYQERTRYAARLFAEGRAPKIILTNDNGQGSWSFTEERNPFNIELEAEELRRAGVPPENIKMLWQSISSTYDEAVLLRDEAARQGLKSLLIVTSPYHSRRALWTARQVFHETNIEVGLDAPPTGQQSPAPLNWWWYWQGWRSVAGEYPKLVYYRFHYS